MKSYLSLVCAAALLASCSGNTNKDSVSATGAATTTTGNVSVSELDQQFLGAWNSKDAAKATSLLADDAQFLQGETHFSGKSEITNKWITPTINTISNLKTSVVSSGTDANTAYEAGTFSVDVLPTSADPTAGTGEGNFLFLWKKGSDGNWKLSHAQLEDLPVRVKK
ncbi:nuclear transport factor 2 family protein [Hymenobacter setariae]|uniref:Nuclear transport factor 2 family protein n=1 Tax=Hymenobacter setariae TaxID=2594794 RepID=A0A558BMG6_9BACT|nr:nuclear transport factor 2 family protein [Hymenobacter setariae]TVT37707.1 nuclear transport factor 2 family protein [Hymenobacter setariae]